jgi:peptidyl-prolyl cis-trans isomerase B (cyclophilin B)
VLIRILVLSAALALLVTSGVGCGTSANNDQVAVLETTYGRIVIEFLPEYAPKHVEAFKQMFGDNFFENVKFHRVIPNRVIQGGDPNSKDDDPTDDGLGQPGQPTIPAEFSTQIKHTRGIVSAARKGDNKDSATSQFFICVGNEPNFDGQYSIFGRVIDGMNTVELIAKAPLRTDSPQYRERPVDPVTIKKSYLSTRAALGLPPKPADAK